MTVPFEQNSNAVRTAVWDTLITSALKASGGVITCSFDATEHGSCTSLQLMGMYA